MQKKIPLLTIVVPCYNEEEILDTTIQQLTIVIDDLVKEQLIAPSSRILFVDDGSKDQTWRLIARACSQHTYVTGLKLARNVGHQLALLAGLERANSISDCTISIDADLQDDISVIREFLLKYREGYEIVYGVRKNRGTDTFFKRSTAQGYYRLMNKLGIPLIYNHADYRLMSKRALCELCRFQESNLFLRGIIPLIGFKTTEVYYDRKERLAGETKYPLRKMLSFALNGLTSFSIAPIRFVTYLGLSIFFISGLAGGYALLQKLLGATDAGWTSLMISIWFIGGLQLMGIGLIGEYISRIFLEVKRRPKYAIDVDLYTNADPLKYFRSNRGEVLKIKKVQWKQ
ncbi:glycosyltransferase family 2 protein [Radiobacillus deserti]|uniref:Glycosyltransferase family 2 protein n=1 Tax=Radiobacillus deserti TaxID=2594883 RepID=A0A516KCF2_9BACI|nr:glycosyltransferase family 2 protein [Radiobacillus deserti]QDP39084.1 glycosyltransferase family 2 protein [Radiobacillus deserti]